MSMTTRGVVRLAVSFLSGAMLLAIQGCGTNTLSGDGAITDSDAATILAGALGSGSSTSGLTGQLEDAASFVAGGRLPKGSQLSSVVLLDTVVTRTRTGLTSYDYWFHLIFELPSPGTLAYRCDMRGVFDTPRLASDDTAHAELSVTDLTSPSLRFNGTYTRLGSELLKFRQEKNSFSSRIVSQLTDLTVEKATRKVTGGVLDVVLSGGFEDGSTVDITAKVTFKGNDLATVVINGKTYDVNLATATVTSQ